MQAQAQQVDETYAAAIDRLTIDFRREIGSLANRAQGDEVVESSNKYNRIIKAYEDEFNSIYERHAREQNIDDLKACIDAFEEGDDVNANMGLLSARFEALIFQEMICVEKIRAVSESERGGYDLFLTLDNHTSEEIIVLIYGTFNVLPSEVLLSLE